ncbi:ubiquitin carboxyl-terminal hydrolase [Ophiostoma piceae UAMH 11346]|uniref:Ubiquitin carboxyl-terminal hydrolase n=1 Tax=Ophiostoma piceae (strain UAMH 11346) TaxID=1262450 RepID=S3C649_OPHP1|nr:ubiquitin carboxyl-terminal hydrolase [Ophiostoma piceae UAMH 11346]
MDRGSRSPESESSQRAGSSDPCSIRPNPFEEHDDTARKRRRTSLNLENSRSLSAESADPDTMTGELANQPAKPLDPLDGSTVPPTSATTNFNTSPTHTAATHTASDSAKNTIPMDTTQDVDALAPAPAPASASTGAQAEAAARPQTPTQDHEPVPAGTPSNVALRLRNSGQQVTSDEASANGDASLMVSPPSPPPRTQPPSQTTRQRQPQHDEQPPPYQEVEDIAGISATIEATASTMALAGHSPALSLSEDNDNSGISPPVEIVDVPDSDDESLVEDDAVTLLSENGTASASGGIPSSPVADPTPKFPYYEISDNIRDHISRMSNYLVTALDENLAREAQIWIEKYLNFVRVSSIHTVRQSYLAYHQLWVALPSLVLNNTLTLRTPGYDLPNGSLLRPIISMFCRSFARLTAHFVQFDIQVRDLPCLVSPPFIAALTGMTERRLLADEDRQELQHVEDDTYVTLFAFLKYNRTPPNGTMAPLMQLLEAQSRVPLSAQAVDNCFTIVALMSSLSRESYKKLTRTIQQENMALTLNGRLVMGLQALEIGRGVFETAIKDHIDFLNSEQTSQQILALGELMYISLSMNPDKAASLAANITDAYPEVQLGQFPDAFVMNWKLEIYSCLVKNSQMSLRLMAVDNLAAELVSFWRRYSDQGSTLSVVKYVANTVLASDVVSYFLSPTCHPEVTERSFNVIGFLAISQTYTNAETDLFWRSVLTTQDPTNLIKMMADVIQYFSHDTAVYFCERFMEVPVSAFTAHMRNLCAAVFRHLLVPSAPRPDSLDESIPFKVCLRLVRELSAPAEDGSVKYPEVLRYFVEKMEDVLKHIGGIDITTQRHNLYRACISGIEAKSDAVLGSLSAILIINRFASDGVVDLEFLMTGDSLTQLLVDNLEHVIQSMSSSVRAPVINGPVNSPRRDMLFYVLSVYSSTLTPELSSRLWDLMFGKSATCDADRDASWSILISFCGGELMQRDNPFLLQCLNTYISSLPTYCFCQGLLNFLQEWLVPELKDPACDLLITEATYEAAEKARDGSDAPGRTANSIALEQLWHIVLTTPTNTIEHGATQLLVKQVYIDSRAIRSSSPENMRMVHMALIERCLRQISSAATKLESLSDGMAKTAENDTEEQMDAQIQMQGLLFLRSVRVLQQFLQQYREAFPQISHDPLETSQHGEPAGLKYQSFDGSQHTEVKPLNIGRLNTVGFLFESLKEATGFDQCKIYARGGPFEPQDISQSLEELNIHDCLLLVRREVPSGTQSVTPMASSLDVEGAILDHFRELWESLGLSEELASEVYELLVHLAVGENMFQLFERDGLSYQDVLHANQPYKSLYALHALREFLVTRQKEERKLRTMPKEADIDIVNDTASPLSPEAAAKIGTSDGFVDTRMDTPDGSTESKSSSGNTIDTPQSKSNDMEIEEHNGHADKAQEPKAASSTYASALAMAANLITGAICDPITTCVPKGNIGLQTDLNFKLLQLLDFVLAGTAASDAILVKLDANLLSHLFAMLSTTLESTPAQLSMNLIELLFRTIIDACSLSRNFWTAFQEHAQTKAMISRLLLADDRLAVRELAETQIGKRAVFGGAATGAEVVSLAEFQEFFMPLIVELIPEAIRHPTKCEGIFNIIEGCFSHPLSTGVPLSLETLLPSTAELILQYDTLEDATQPEVGDYAMYGLAKMLELVYRGAQGSGELPRDFVCRLFWKHLFPPWQQDGRRVSASSSSSNGSNADMLLTGETISPSSQDLHIVQGSRTRTVLMKLILAIVDDDPRQLRKLVKNLDQLVPAEPSNEDDSLYHYDLPLVFDRNRALRAPCGYVGLRNLSNTCYFNSLLTQLFMNVEFRRFIIQVDPSNENGESMVFQTRLLFSFMQNSVRRFLDTQTCTNTIKTYEDGPIDISIQMDVDEFFNLLFDRWEGQMPTGEDKKQLRSFYGGQIVQQIRSHQCEHVSERLEPFSAIQCDIKGKSNLMESLEAYVEGEVMEGENKYKCSDCNEHVVATKRACLKEVPDHLIFHLKRFEFNLRNGTRNKINDYFSFPHEIDMRPYTIDQLSNPEKKQTPDIFELVGVLVHAGTAESGHYYSFIRERPSTKPQGSWVEFNDDAVSDWDPAMMEAQCFGGVDFRPAMAGYGNDGGEVIEKSYSAYMLFYQRRSALAREQEALAQTGLASPRKVDVLSGVAHHIHRENAQLLRRHVLFDPQHLPFVGKVLSQVQHLQPGGQCSANHRLENRALQMALGHLDQVATRTRDLPDFLTLLNSIESMGKKCAQCSLAIYDYFAARPQVFHQMVQRCPDPGVRHDIAKLVIDALQTVRSAFTQNYFSLPIIHLDDKGNMVSNENPTDSDGDLYIDGAEDTVKGGQDPDARTNGITTQRNPLEMVHKSTIVLQAQGLIRILWDHMHILIRSWPETFGFMQMFVEMGRAEVAAFMDVGGLRRALEVITADGALSGQSMQISRMLLNIDRRQATRPVSYETLISVISTVMAGMYMDTNSHSAATLFHVEDNVSRFAVFLQNPDEDLPMLKSEFQTIAQDWPSHFAGQGVNIFVDKLVGLNQNRTQTDAIIVRLMRRHPVMKKMVFMTLKAGFDALANKHHAPYVRAAMAYARHAEATDSSGLLMIVSIAEQCRVLTNNINRRVYFEAVRDLFFDSGNRRFATSQAMHNATMAEDADADGASTADPEAPPPYNMSLLEENFRMVLIWAPGLLAYYEPAVNADVEEFLGDIFLDGGPDVQFDEADGGDARTDMVRTIAKQFGIELLTFLRDNFILTRTRANTRVIRSIERIATKLQPFFVDAPANDPETFQYRQLLPVVTDLSGPMPPPSDVDDLEEDYESGVDEGDWNDDSSDVEDDSAGNISMSMGADLDADMP